MMSADMYEYRRIEMAVNRVPVLKRCRSLGMDPIYLGVTKKSNRQLKRSNRKMCAKRAGEGVSPVVTILQMDFQGRGEIIVAKT